MWNPDLTRQLGLVTGKGVWGCPEGVSMRLRAGDEGVSAEIRGLYFDSKLPDFILNFGPHPGLRRRPDLDPVARATIARHFQHS